MLLPTRAPLTKAARIAVLSIGCFTSGLVAGAEPDGTGLPDVLALIRSPERLTAGSHFELSEWTGHAIAGKLEVGYDSQRLVFRCLAPSPARASVHVEFSGGEVLLDAEADFPANLRILDGHEHALSIGERVALTTLVAHLERRLQPYQPQIPAHEDFLFRVVSCWAEAPVGWPLRRREIILPPMIEAPKPTPADMPASGVDTPEGGGDDPEGGGCPNDVDQLVGCNDPGLCGEGSDGTARICPNPCGASLHTLWHDACPIHDYCSESLPTGCPSCDCRGRCGPTCGSNDGAGVYTIDCAEHDRCCHIHGACLNPDALYCGDEFADAMDDFFFADNCPGGCPAGGGCTSCPSFDSTINAFPDTNWVLHSTSVPTGGCYVYRVALTAGHPYTFKTGCGDAATANFDTVIDVFRPSGDCPYSPNWTNDDGCESQRSRVTLTAATSGNHYVKVRAFCSTGGVPSSGSFTLALRHDPVTIAGANPPNANNNPYQEGQAFVDVLDTGTGTALTAGIGAAGTPNQGSIQYSPIRVTFSALPITTPTPANTSITCTGGNCPTVTAVVFSGGTTFSVSLSGAIPPLQCTTLLFAGTASGEKLQYRSSPGNVNLDAAANTQDLLFLIQRLNDGSANAAGNLARYNINRSGAVNTQDLLRLVQLLNGVNTTQVFNGSTVAACP
ncbi:MAG TPA: hypothetical protein VGM03_02380 [Phycisphaerae bacterium]|jgi:hypothetical protein